MDTNSEVNKFFEGLPKDSEQVSDFIKDNTVIPAKDADIDPEEVDDSIKNRQHRRLEKRLQDEREANIILNARLAERTEAERISKESDGKIDPRLLRAFGTTEAGQEASELFQTILNENRLQAKKDAIEELKQSEIQEKAEQKKYESFIDDKLESLENTHNIDLTSNSPKATKMRSEFLEMVQELSPKDANGTLTDYADFDSAFEMYQKTHTTEKVDNTRQREIANRSMTRSGSQAGQQTTITPGFRGWERDYNIGN